MDDVELPRQRNERRVHVGPLRRKPASGSESVVEDERGAGRYGLRDEVRRAGVGLCTYPNAEAACVTAPSTSTNFPYVGSHHPASYVLTLGCYLLQREYKPREHHDLSALKQIYSTGSPLAAHLFDYVYRDISPDVLLGSITGSCSNSVALERSCG